MAHNVEGVGTYLRFEGLAHGLASLGAKVTLIAAREGHFLPKHAHNHNLHIIFTPVWLSKRVSNGGLAIEDIIYRLWHVMGHSYDVVHASEHRPAASLPAMLARRLHKSIYISDWGDLWGWGGIMEERSRFARVVFGAQETYWESAIHKHADAVTAISTDLANRARALKIPETRIVHLPNGIDTNLIKPAEDSMGLRKHLGLPMQGKLLIYAGQAPIDVDLIWQSFERVYREFKDVFLLVLGRKWSEPVGMGEAASHIIQLGHQPWEKYLQYLACGDIMLLPYRNNSRNLGRWPGKLAFYMSVGRPIVSNPTGDVKEIFEQHNVGILADETPEAFAAGILLLLKDEALAYKLGQQARSRAESHFTWLGFAQVLYDFYQSQLQHRFAPS